MGWFVYNARVNIIIKCVQRSLIFWGVLLINISREFQNDSVKPLRTVDELGSPTVPVSTHTTAPILKYFIIWEWRISRMLILGKLTKYMTINMS